MISYSPASMPANIISITRLPLIFRKPFNNNVLQSLLDFKAHGLCHRLADLGSPGRLRPVILLGVTM